MKFRKSQVSFNEQPMNIALNSSSELTNKDQVTGGGPPVMTKYVSADADASSMRNPLTKIPTNKLVYEIAEVINDESPNIAKNKAERNTLHMGFQPVNESSAAGSNKNITFHELTAAHASSG